MEIPAIRDRITAVRTALNTDAVWNRFSRDQQVWGYVDRHSIAPGESWFNRTSACRDTRRFS